MLNRFTFSREEKKIHPLMRLDKFYYIEVESAAKAAPYF